MKLFHKGVTRRFDGRRSITEFEMFIDKVLKEVVNVEEVEGLVTLTAENFDDHIKTGLHFVEFFAPWCVHCKHFEPTWKAIAKHFEKNPDITICKVDCTKESSKCQELKINGFPMLKLYKDGEEVDQYNAERRMETLLSYINNNLHHYGGVAPEDSLQEQDQVNDVVQQNDDELVDLADTHPVVELLDSTFDIVLEDPTFVKFYVPWCKYCQRLKPIWETLGKWCQRAGGPIIARIDCSKFPETCERHQVSQYPTLALFKGGHRYNYHEDRDIESLFKFAQGIHDEL